jgi:hypothetical protein
VSHWVGSKWSCRCAVVVRGPVGQSLAPTTAAHPNGQCRAAHGPCSCVAGIASAGVCLSPGSPGIVRVGVLLKSSFAVLGDGVPMSNWERKRRNAGRLMTLQK